MIIECCSQERASFTFCLNGERFCQLKRVWTGSCEHSIYTTLRDEPTCAFLWSPRLQWNASRSTRMIQWSMGLKNLADRFRDQARLCRNVPKILFNYFTSIGLGWLNRCGSIYRLVSGLLLIGWTSCRLLSIRMRRNCCQAMLEEESSSSDSDSCCECRRSTEVLAVFILAHHLDLALSTGTQAITIVNAARGERFSSRGSYLLV
jgi:hypothetical protein